MPLSVPAPVATPDASAWNAMDMGPGMGLANGDRTATWLSGSGRCQVAGTKIQTAGAYYFEALAHRYNVNLGTYWAVGIGRPASDRDIDLGQNPEHYAYMRNGARYISGAYSDAALPTFGLGAVIGVCVDLTANTISWLKNNVPVGTAVSIASAAAGYVICASSSSVYDACTVRTVESQFSYPVPSGFSAWG